MTSMRLAAGAIALLSVLSILSAHSILAARSAPPDAQEIVRRAEEVRSPDVDYAVDFALRVLNPDSAWKERHTAYSMIAHGKGHSLILLREPASFYPGSLLIAEGSYWLLLPNSTVPFELSARNVVDGDVAYADLARGDLVDAYTPRLVEEDRFLGEECYVLELLRAKQRAISPRIMCWVSKKRFQPRRFDFYGESGKLLRTAYYQDYRTGPLGLRSMTVVVDNQAHPGERTTMTFSDLRKFDVSGFEFSTVGLIAFRDAAKARFESLGKQSRLEDLTARVPAKP